MTDDPGTAPEAQPKGEPLAERVGAIETEQREQRGILERIEAALGKGSTAPTSPESGTGSGSPEVSPSVAEQVRRGVEEIEAEKQRKAEAEARENADKAWRASVDERLPERRPSEPATGRKQKLAERMFGKADAR